MKYRVTVIGDDGRVVFDDEVETNDPGQIAQRAAGEFLKRTVPLLKSLSYTVKIVQIPGGSDT